MTDHNGFDSLEGDVIMSESSRSLGYGSSAPDLGVTLGFLSPQDLVLPQSLTSAVVGPLKYPLPEVDETLGRNLKKRRYEHTILCVFELTVQNAPTEYQAYRKGKQHLRTYGHTSLRTVPIMETEGMVLRVSPAKCLLTFW